MKHHRLKYTILCLLLLIVITFGASVCAETEKLTIGCLAGKSDYYYYIFPEIGLYDQTVTRSNYPTYTAMEEALVSGDIDVAFPIVANDGNDGYILSDCAGHISMSVVYKDTLSPEVFARIAVDPSSFVYPYVRHQYPASVIVTGADPQSSFESYHDCLNALAEDKATCVIIPTAEVRSSVYLNDTYSRFKTAELDQPCSVYFALSKTNQKTAEQINSFLASAKNMQHVQAVINTYIVGYQQSHNFFSDNLILIVSLFVAAALAILFVSLYRHFKANQVESLAAIHGLSADYECVTLLDINSDHETRFRISPVFTRLIPGWDEDDDWAHRMRLFAENLVVSEDKIRFMKETTKEFIADKLKDSDAYSFSYRVKLNDAVIYFRTKFVREKTSRNCVIAGFSNADSEIRKEIALQKKIQEKETADRLSMQMVSTLVKMIEAKDRYINGHSVRVATYAREIARRSGLNEEEQLQIYYMGLLHDIGKVGIPDDVINKTSSLSDEEYALVKQHSQMGAQILESITEMPKLRIGALNHHERYDGKGYPQGLSGK